MTHSLPFAVALNFMSPDDTPRYFIAHIRMRPTSVPNWQSVTNFPVSTKYGTRTS